MVHKVDVVMHVLKEKEIKVKLWAYISAISEDFVIIYESDNTDGDLIYSPLR